MDIDDAFEAGFSDIRDGRRGIVDRNWMLSTLDGRDGDRRCYIISLSLSLTVPAFVVMVREAVPLFFISISVPISLSEAICLPLLGCKVVLNLLHVCCSAHDDHFHPIATSSVLCMALLLHSL